MSHLDHIVRFKERLDEVGVKCPVEQQSLTMEAFMRALIRWKFRCNNSITLSEEEEDAMFRTLDMWNRASPLKGRYIIELIKRFLGSLQTQLLERGVFPEEEPSICLPDGEKVCLCSLVEFTDLVTYLAAEAKEYNE